MRMQADEEPESIEAVCTAVRNATSAQDRSAITFYLTSLFSPDDVTKAQLVTFYNNVLAP